MSDVSKTNALRAAIAYLKPIAESATVGGYGEALNAVMGAAEREIATRVPVQGEPNVCLTHNALDGAPEPEWEVVAEYGVKYAPTNNRASYTVRFGYESREDAEHLLGRLGRNQRRNPDRLMYREVRTGPWLPVEGESKP